ncbi:MAG TPA: GTP cyclohydrolase I FolE [Rhizobiaceae bacterium]|nr:GTP cyclohydrolase I FolE [Rhizobiaceae bacterium]
MDAIIRNFPPVTDKAQKPEPKPAYMDKPVVDRPSREEAEAAVRTLLRWTGDDPNREGLKETPERVAKAYREMFGGYDQCPAEELGRTFEEVAGYDDLVLIKDISFHSHCEHHMVPIIGKAHVAYLPDGKVVGLSKIARVVDIFARRLQTQEAMTAQIAGVIQNVLKPRGVAVMIEAEHMCMAMRGIRKQGSTTLTSTFTGVFRDQPEEQARFITLIRDGHRG